MSARNVRCVRFKRVRCGRGRDNRSVSRDVDLLCGGMVGAATGNFVTQLGVDEKAGAGA